MLELTARLQAVADLVPQGSILADIGTDHAYIPAYLIQSGAITRAFACDIKKGPLQNAEKTVKEYGLKGVKFVLCDGLSAFSGSEFDTIVIAGMGGEMIASILEKAPWCKDKRYTFILQPMTKADFLRRFLYKNGFQIAKETLAAEGNKLYNIFKVEYCAKCVDISDAFALLGRSYDDPLFEIKRRRELERLGKILSSLENKSDSFREHEQLASLIRQVEVYPC